MASTHRLEQINENIRNEVAEIFKRELEIPSDILVSISKVNTFEDLRHAQVWLSILPIDKRSKIQNLIDKDKSTIQQLLGKRLKMKPVPKLQYFTDFSTEKAFGIEQVIDKALKEL
jgi:ribosome-binding factor A